MQSNQDIYKSTLSWLEREMGSIDYGEVGIVFSFSKGKITKIKKVNEESVAPGKREVKK